MHFDFSLLGICSCWVLVLPRFQPSTFLSCLAWVFFETFPLFLLEITFLWTLGFKAAIQIKYLAVTNIWRSHLHLHYAKNPIILNYLDVRFVYGFIGTFV